MKVAVILLNYNSSDDCRKCISFLKRQEYIEPEPIVVDNCSRPEELEKVRLLCREESCTLLENGENRGYSAGNNIGLRYAASQGYEYALIANPDMEFPQTDYLLRLTECAEKDKSIVVVGSDIIGKDGIHQNPMYRDGNWKSSFGWISGLLGKKQIDAYQFIDNYRKSHICHKVSGCCFLIRMDFVQSIGYLDENVFLYCEEAILSRQVEQAGLKMFYLADVQAIHAHVKSEKGDPIARFKHWKRSRIYFINRYSGDSWMGKKIAGFSMWLYVELFCLFRKLNNVWSKQKKEVNL
ncbi:glycosyltransferase family 2 protein [Alistipes senegalensis]|uniref:glycosyltransferase family 2 protein n=1 Tax=Alistipes senegalensis TaxID=1288121 RepID=UPI00242F1516|nr:glycosyltransferase family 2 protein [Alistipes senegalensis]